MAEDEIEEEFEKLDPEVKATSRMKTEIEEKIDDESKESPETEDFEPEEDMYKSVSEDYQKYEKSDDEPDAVTELKKQGYVIKDRLEDDIDQMKKSLEPTPQEDKDAEYMKKRGIPKHFGKDY